MAAQLKGEGGITVHSLFNARTLIASKGCRPEKLRFKCSQGNADYTVIATWPDNSTFTFTGFSWGYGYEGPHGLDEFLEMCNAGFERALLERLTGDDGVCNIELGTLR